MKNIITITLLFFFLGLLKIQAQEIKFLTSDEIKDLLKNTENELSIIHFWATWCAPCITEFPHFNEKAMEYSSSPEKVKFYLISLDFPSQIDSHLLPFLKNQKVKTEIFLLKNLDYDSWISKINENWKGNIPATLFLNNKKQINHFVPGTIHKDTLTQIINRFLKPTE